MNVNCKFKLVIRQQDCNFSEDMATITDQLNINLKTIRMLNAQKQEYIYTKYLTDTGLVSNLIVYSHCNFGTGIVKSKKK